MLHLSRLPHSTNGLGSGSNVRLPRVWIGTTLISSVATFFVLLCFNSDPSVGIIPYACSNLTTSTSELVASLMGFEVSYISASYTAGLDPWPLLLLLLPLPLLHHYPLVFLLELGVVMVVDRHNLEKWPCLLHLKQTDEIAGHSLI